MHAILCRCYVAVSVANGNPSLIPTRNEHTECMHMLKVSNIPEVAVEFEHYHTYVALHMYIYI